MTPDQGLQLDDVNGPHQQKAPAQQKASPLRVVVHPGAAPPPPPGSPAAMTQQQGTLQLDDVHGLKQEEQQEPSNIWGDSAEAVRKRTLGRKMTQRELFRDVESPAATYADTVEGAWEAMTEDFIKSAPEFFDDNFYRRRAAESFIGQLVDDYHRTVAAGKLPLDAAAAISAPFMGGPLKALVAKPLALAIREGFNVLPGHPGVPSQEQVENEIMFASQFVKPAPGYTIKLPDRVLPSKELKAAASKHYKTVDASGMRIRPNAVEDLAKNVQETMEREGFDPTLHPNTKAAYQRVLRIAGKKLPDPYMESPEPEEEEAPEEEVQGALPGIGHNKPPEPIAKEPPPGKIQSLSSMERTRRVVGNAIEASILNKSDRRLARIILDHIDDFIDNLHPGQLQGVRDENDLNALKTARSMWKRAAKAEQLEKLAERAKVRSSGKFNYEETLIAEYRKLALSERGMARFTADEQAAIKEVVMGGRTALARNFTKLMRLVGGLALRGPVSWLANLAAAGSGYLPGGYLGGVIAPMGGELARLVNRLNTMRRENSLGTLVRRGKRAEPIFAKRPPPPDLGLEGGGEKPPEPPPQGGGGGTTPPASPQPPPTPPAPTPTPTPPAPAPAAAPSSNVVPFPKPPLASAAPLDPVPPLGPEPPPAAAAGPDYSKPPVPRKTPPPDHLGLPPNDWDNRLDPVTGQPWDPNMPASARTARTLRAWPGLRQVAWEPEPTPQPQPPPAAENPKIKPEPELEPETTAPPEDIFKPGAAVQISPTEVAVDAKRFQFKGDANEQGVTNRLLDVQGWDPLLANIVTVFRDKDGVMWIADGHQRLALAKRLIEAGKKDIYGNDIFLNAQILDANDPVMQWTDADARMYSAGKNIAEGTGTLLDAAKVLREAANTKVKLPELPPRSVLARDGQGLAKLGNDAWGMWVHDEAVPGNQAAIVGRLVADPLQQVEALKVLKEAKPANLFQAEMLVRDMLAMGMEKGKTTGGLFGPEEFASSAILERAKIVDGGAKIFARDKTINRTLVNEWGKITEHGHNVLDSEYNKGRLSEDERAAALLTQLATRHGPVSDALTAIAKRLKSGAITQRAANAEFVQAVRQQIAKGLEGGSGVGGDKPSDGGSGEQAPALEDESRPYRVNKAERDKRQAEEREQRKANLARITTIRAPRIESEIYRPESKVEDDTAYYNDLSPEYVRALEKSRVAEQAYQKTLADYRGMKIGDKEFIEAQKAYKASQAEFDKAFEAEQKRPRPKPQKESAETGGGLFNTEPGAVDAKGRPLPQTIIPGAERSALQAAKAREAAGKGLKTSKAVQKEAGPLFAPGEGAGGGTQGSLFDEPRWMKAKIANEGGHYTDLTAEVTAAMQPPDDLFQGRPGDYTPGEWHLQQISDYLTRRGGETGHEAMVVYNLKDGKPDFAFSAGLPRKVSWSNEGDVGRAFLNPDNAYVSLHNHPRDTAMSGSDNIPLRFPGNRWVMSVSKSGTWGASRLNPEWAAQFGDDRLGLEQELTKAVKDIDDDIFAKTQQALFNGDMGLPGAHPTQEELDNALHHFDNLMLAKRGIIDYLHGVNNIPERVADVFYRVTKLDRGDLAARPLRFREGTQRILAEFGRDGGRAAPADAGKHAPELPSGSAGTRTPWHKPQQMKLLDERNPLAPGGAALGGQ